VLLLTDEDDFNALASVLLADCVDGRVYRLAPPQRSQGVVGPYRCPWLNPWMAGRSGRWVSRLAHGLEVLERNWPAGCGVCAAVGAAIRRCLRPVMNARP
jgi:hypothetical protein